MKVLIRNQQRLIKINLRRVRKDSLRLLRSFSLSRTELGILFVNDVRMKRLNATYRRMNTTTDVLSFPIYATVKDVPADRPSLLGDIVINPLAAKRQSARYNVTCQGEIRRLLIHAFLHLLGYDHEGTRYKAEKMRKEERRLQDVLKTLD